MQPTGEPGGDGRPDQRDRPRHAGDGIRRLFDSGSQGDDQYLLHFGRTPRRCTVPDLLLHAPTSLEEASQILARYQGEARAIAGGTAVVLMLHQGLIRPPALVRLDRVQEMDGISVEAGCGPREGIAELCHLDGEDFGGLVQCVAVEHRARARDD